MPGTDPQGLDLRRLRDYLDARSPGLCSGELAAEIIPGGRSNLSYRVGDGRSEWVLRRPPLGHVLPTAHDMAREHRVITALAGTAVPVPATVLLCEDPAILGAPFFLMEYAPGTPYRTADQLDALGAERTRAIVLSLVDTLVDLHTVAPAEVGLSDFGRPDGFLERQVRRWGRQLDASRSRDLPGVDELRSGLARRLPASPAATVLHGDYRLDNVLIGADDRITAVLDWEMSTLGDPLTDLAVLVAYSGSDMPAVAGVSTAVDAPGYPDTGEIVARYAERSGRDVSELDWYLGLAAFKLAVILEGIHYRYTQGNTVGADFEGIGDAVPDLVASGLRYVAD
ncbi:aminoglycoside phosphotransferase (APT) family kinase protein [Murinocardiopsis flavida]|uniref:Aminoglycoside phosphotransferase (APT) family kinase protein n=1 Tax=Murinocardiopsis flavida TaxID=645275 RepID=A0A2P8DLL0_9ACTN|nr:phosphotransferase family protein [Murinocardiopsis flavida]PSK98113.1 aminoglycoside phosphotransferase (APT) family kinase protein [Murinocardiopsis flavida]